MIYITNNPELSQAFQSDEVKEFLLNMLEELSDAHSLKRFLKHGHLEFYKEQIEQLSKSFTPIASLPDERNAFSSIMRVIDKQTFSVGDKVLDKVSNQVFPISRMYEDDRGLHIKLDVDDKGTMTWRNLSQIDHEQEAF